MTKIANSFFNVSIRSFNIAQEQFIQEPNTLFLGLHCWWSEYSKKFFYLDLQSLTSQYLQVWFIWRRSRSEILHLWKKVRFRNNFAEPRLRIRIIQSFLYVHWNLNLHGNQTPSLHKRRQYFVHQGPNRTILNCIYSFPPKKFHSAVGAENLKSESFQFFCFWLKVEVKLLFMCLLKLDFPHQAARYQSTIFLPWRFFGTEKFFFLLRWNFIT